VPAAVLAVVTALPAAALAAPTPTPGQEQEQEPAAPAQAPAQVPVRAPAQAPAQTPVRAPAQDTPAQDAPAQDAPAEQGSPLPRTLLGSQQASAPVPCTLGVGDEDKLADAFRRAGTITLQPGCTYTMTKRHGSISALPPIEYDTIVEGQGSTITWGGVERVGSLIEIAGPRVRLDLRDVRLKPVDGMTAMRIRRGSSVSISQTSGGRDLGDLRGFNGGPGNFRDKFEQAGLLASWLLPILAQAPRDGLGALGQAMREELEQRPRAQTPSADSSRQ
jgi:hypothetical protein